MKRIIAVSLTALTLIAGLAGPAGAVPKKHNPVGAYITFLFSRTEMGGADNCTPDPLSGVPLTTSMTYLDSLGLTATGSLVTGSTQDATEYCTHANETLAASWADTTALAALGMTFVSHTATYPSPAKWAKLTAQQQWDETCGSAQTIQQHGLTGSDGMIAYPGGGTDAVYATLEPIQEQYGSQCFAWGRRYSKGHGITLPSAAAAFPYWQYTMATVGGPCYDTTAACSAVVPLTGTAAYRTPAQVISQINLLDPGDWLTIQSYVLVTGVSPPGSTEQWDCTSPDPNEHWTNDPERYCYSDWQIIAQAVASSGATVTDPLSVGIAMGRPASYPEDLPK